MPYRLCVTNLMLHGVDVPDIRFGDSLDIKNFSEYYGDDLVDVAALNEAVICGLTPEKACNFKEFAA